jgi:hypothetical protein
LIDHKEREVLGGEAQKLMDNPILAYAFKKTKERAIATISESNHDETALREHEYLKLKVLDDIQSIIKNLIREGDVSRMQLNKAEVPKLKSLDR